MNDTDTPWLSAEQQHTWRTFLAMQSRLTAHLGRQLQADSELSLADYEVLVHLTDVAEGRLRVMELARDLDWEKSRLSHHLARMVKRGLIARKECATDGRGSFIAITPAGRSTIEAAAPRHVETVRRLLFDALDPEQTAALTALSEQILGRIEQREECPEG
jgi:DNA-binding MarR family transcriptional regulator